MIPQPQVGGTCWQFVDWYQIFLYSLSQIQSAILNRTTPKGVTEYSVFSACVLRCSIVCHWKLLGEFKGVSMRLNTLNFTHNTLNCRNISSLTDGQRFKCLMFGVCLKCPPIPGLRFGLMWLTSWYGNNLVWKIQH